VLPQGPVNKMWLLTSFLIGNCKCNTKSDDALQSVSR